MVNEENREDHSKEWLKGQDKVNSVNSVSTWMGNAKPLSPDKGSSPADFPNWERLCHWRKPVQVRPQRNQA